jgi:hypothetical protein
MANLLRLALIFRLLVIGKGPGFAARAIIAAGMLLCYPAIGQAQRFVVAWSALSALNSPFWVMNDAGFLELNGGDGWLPAKYSGLKTVLAFHVPRLSAYADKSR